MTRATIIVDAATEPKPKPPAEWQNPRGRFDVNNDAKIDQQDADILRDDLATNGTRVLPTPTDGLAPPPFLDVNGDGSVSDADLVAVNEAIQRAREPLVNLRFQAVNSSGVPIDRHS